MKKGWDMKSYKNIIIGFGKAGKTLAKTLATKGEEVLLIEESDKMYGGTCINVACIPSKTLIVNGEKGKNFDEAMQIKNHLIEALRGKNYHMIADEDTATVINAKARFLSDYEIELTETNGNISTVRGERIFINTGAKSIIPNIKGIDNNPYILTSKEALSLDKLPKHLIIIGSGYIGLEFATMYRQFGSKVTILEQSDRFIAREDKEISDMVRANMEADGIEFIFSAKNIHFDNNKVYFENEGKEKFIESDAILLATGRKPNTDGLGLENTNIKLDDRGAIVVDNKLKTTVTNIWAMGDVKGGPQFTYVSLDDFRILASQFFGDNSRTTDDREIIPYTVFLNPPLSNVGLTEDAVKAKGYDYKVFKLPMAAVPKAHIMGNTKGMFKVIVNASDNTILGATHYGIESQEVINIFALAIKAKLPYTILKNNIFTHPTIAEAINDVFK